MSQTPHRLFLLSGPSCAGKSPLLQAIGREFPDLGDRLQTPVLYNSRPQRPGEVDGEDYHFRPRDEIEKLCEDDRYLLFPTSDDAQAVDLDELRELLDEGDVFYEGHVHVALALKERTDFDDAEVVDMFLSPLSLEEVRDQLDATASFTARLEELMRRRLMRRGLSKHRALSLPQLEDIEARAGTAFHALQHACEFSHVLPSHDGEDSDNWTVMSKTIGDARRVVRAMAALLRGERTDLVESWPDDLLPPPDCRNGDDDGDDDSD